MISRDAVKLVAQMVRDPFELWLNTHVDEGKRIAELVHSASDGAHQGRAEGRAPEDLRRRSAAWQAYRLRVRTIPSGMKLFIVEGDSAGGSAKQARDKEFQAMLPLKGKPKNTWQDSGDMLYSNKEIEAIALAIGVDHHRARGQRRSRKSPLSQDRRPGGRGCGRRTHSGAVLTLFFRHFPRLIERGHVFVAQPPLYRIDVPAAGKTKPARKLYALDQQELQRDGGKAHGRGHP